MELDLTRKVLAALEKERVRYVVFDGVALNLQGLARATEHLDLFIAPTRNNIERLRAALRGVFPDDPSVDEITADDLLGEYPAVQYVPLEGGFHIDLLTRLGEEYNFEDLRSERLDFAGIEVSVVTARTLYEMKKDTIRPRDRADAERLKHRFGFESEEG